MGEANPFRIAEHVSGEYFTDRGPEVTRIRRALLDPSALLLYGPRRMGKSSAMGKAAAAAHRARPAAIVVRADLATATSLFDVSARLLRSLYVETRSLRLRFEDLLGSLRGAVTLRHDEVTGIPSISFGVERRTATEDEKRNALAAVMGRLVALKERVERPVAVVLDEFQAIHGFGGESAEWHLRDLMQTHPLSFVCAGSEESLIREMIGPKRAFYKFFELLHLGPLPDDHFGRWLEERLRGGRAVDAGVGAEIIRMAGPRTQDVVQVARQLYYRSSGLSRPIAPGDVQAALDDVVRSEDALIRTIWSGLSAQQQDVLRVLAHGAQQILSTEVRDRYGLAGPSSVQKAVAALIARGLLTRELDALSFDSPFLRRWVEVEVARDVG